MKTTFFATALISLISVIQGTKLVQDKNYTEFDYELAQADEEYPEYAQIYDDDEEDWQLAEINSASDADSEFAQSDVESDSDVDAEAEFAQSDVDSAIDEFGQTESEAESYVESDSDADAEAEFAQSDVDSVLDEFGQTESEAETYGEVEADNESEDLAQIDVGSESEGEGQLKANACQQIVNGVTIRLSTPECNGAAAANPNEVKVPFESAMLGALKELGNKSNDLATALDIQFKKNAALAAPKMLAISGTLAITPNVDAVMVTPPPVVGAPVAPAANTQTITLVAGK